MEVLRRVIGSKKTVIAFVGMLATLLVDLGVPDVSDLAIQGVEALFGILLLTQGALDFKHGSPSDGTTPQ